MDGKNNILRTACRFFLIPDNFQFKVTKTKPMKRLLLITLLFVSHFLSAQEYDLVIINGKLIDGTGNSWQYADIGIKEGKILAVGNLKTATAIQIIDAKNMVV